jgi:hypothetical protein
MKPAIIALFATMTATMGQQPPSPEQSKEANLNAYVDLLRKDVKTEKKAILTELMDLTSEEGAKFWPVYGDYEKALTVLADERLGLVRMYAQNYGVMTDQMAIKLATGVLDLDAKRNQLKRQYFQKFSHALNPKLAARFLQIENQLEKIVDLQIASLLPVIE